jgi:hypothetical protein
MSAMLAQFESEMLSLRITRGWAERRLANKPARGRVPWGYRYNEDRSALELDPVEGPRARRMIKVLRENDWRCTTALRIYKAFHGSIPLKTVQALKIWISNPVLRGGLGYRFDGAPKKRVEQDKRLATVKRTYTYTFKETVWDRHEPLLNPEEWAQIEARFEANRRMWGKNAISAPRLLTGLCVCAVCKKRMTYRSGKWVAALCCHNSLDCPRRYRAVREQVIVDQINASLSQRAEDVATLVADEPPRVRALRKEIVDIEAKQDPRFEPTLKIMKDVLETLIPQSVLDPALVDALRDPLVWTHMDSPTLRDTYEQLLDRVEVSDPQTVQVICRF